MIAELGKETNAFTVDYARVEPNDPQFKGDNGKRDDAKVNAAIKAVLAEKMSPEALKQYDAVIFANTTGDLPLPDKQAFLDWIKSGKGFVGMHSGGGYIPRICRVCSTCLGAEFRILPTNSKSSPSTRMPNARPALIWGRIGRCSMRFTR